MGTYFVKVECRNCGFRGEIEISQGKTVQYTECPTCKNDFVLKLQGTE